MMMRQRNVLLVMVLVALAPMTGACGTANETPTSAEAVAAAEQICPIMWSWVKDVGTAFNLASTDVASIDDLAERRDRWETAFGEIEMLNDQLADDLAPYRQDEILGPLVAEVERDLPMASEALDDIRQLFVDYPEIDEEPHQIRTSQVIVRMEKVIDLPKPDLKPLDPDGVLVPAFRQVASCQQSIRDVDDGSTRSNG
ncbi:MAG: hypothetical protein GY724_09340 [Actinomycetia bacterium]|nr:hypothetical protein [Actinomycetes bacterium]